MNPAAGPRTLRLMLIAGEASGDAHGARLVQELAAQAQAGGAGRPTLWGFGGPLMEAAGMRLLADFTREMAIVGVTQVLANLPLIRRMLRLAEAELECQRPDALIVIDYPGFNLRAARMARARGIPVFYYITPQVWAWHKGRIATLRETVTRALVVFPFEEKFFEEAGVPVTFVGHPLLDAEAESEGFGAAGDAVAPWAPTAAAGRLIGLVPGSRRSEVRRHLPVMLEAARMLRAENPALEFAIPVSKNVNLSFFDEAKQLVGSGFPLHMVPERHAALRRGFRAALCKSGTSTLELALAGVPMVVLYKMSALSYAIASRLVSLQAISLVNIVAESPVVPELIQGEASGQSLARALAPLVREGPTRAEQLAALEAVRQRLGGPGASARAASEILSAIHNGFGPDGPR